MSGKATKECVTLVPFKSGICITVLVRRNVCHTVCVMRCVSCGVSPTLGHIMQLCEKNKTWQNCKYQNSDSRLHRHPRSGAHTELFICCIRNFLGDTCCNCSLRFTNEGALEWLGVPASLNQMHS